MTQRTLTPIFAVAALALGIVSIGLPAAWDFPHVDRETFCLPEAQVGLWGGFVFINFDPQCEPLDSYLECLPEHFKNFPLEDRYKAVHGGKVLPCNWKLAQEAFMEGFHIASTHPQSVEYTADTNTQYDVFEGRHVNRFIMPEGVASPALGDYPQQKIVDAMQRDMPFYGNKPIQLAEGESARERIADHARARFSKSSGRDFSKLSTSEAIDLIQYFLFPNLGPWAGMATPLVYRFRPHGDNPEECIMEIMMLFAKNADGTTDLNGTLLNVASAYQATQDPAEKAAIASAAFGKSWTEMVDVLDKSRSTIAELQGLSLGVTEADIRRLEDYKKARAGLSQATGDVKLGIGRQVIQGVTYEMTQLAGATRVVTSTLTGNFGDAWDTLSGKTIKAKSAFASTSADIRGRLVASALQAAFGFDAMGRSIELASVKAARAAQAFAGLFDTQTTAISAQVRFKDAVAGLSELQTQAAGRASKYADAQDNVAAALGDQSRAAADGARRIADVLWTPPV